MITIGVCITPHGFGHAARCCAVMEALSELVDVHFEIITTVPAWFFYASLPGCSFTLYPVFCDIGLVQQNSLEEDFDNTLQLLAGLYPFPENLVDMVATVVSSCRMVICDVAVLGIAAARKAGIPSVLLENFTWDWIYEQYLPDYPAFDQFIRYLGDLYAQADLHLQARPVCVENNKALQLDPLARKPRQSREQVRHGLQISDTDELVLVTMGGIAGHTLPLDAMEKMEQCFVLVGQEVEAMVVRKNIRLLPSDSGLYHPDLVVACDAVVGKVGYSTLAEVYQSATPFGYIPRPSFAESSVLTEFIENNMVGRSISFQQFTGGDWLDVVPDLCRMHRHRQQRSNGAAMAAQILIEAFSMQ